MMKIEKPGLYADVPEADYHADPCPTASLSASIIHIANTQSLLHASNAHPHFNPSVLHGEREPTRPKEIGTAAHKMILGKGRDLEVLPYDDYRGKDAQRARQHFYVLGKSPILRSDHGKALNIANAAREGIKGTELEGCFDTGKPEVTAVWHEAGTWCRCRFDWMPEVQSAKHVTIVDVKTTAASAHPSDWAATMAGIGGATQALWYRRALIRLVPHLSSVDFKFLVVEQNEPYGVTVGRPDNKALDEAQDVLAVIPALWAECLRTGQWPGYPKDTAFFEQPVWQSYKHESRMLQYKHLLEVMACWQAPLNADKPKELT